MTHVTWGSLLTLLAGAEVMQISKDPKTISVIMARCMVTHIALSSYKYTLTFKETMWLLAFASGST